jgi:ATP-binding cassette subfamily F protein uup
MSFREERELESLPALLEKLEAEKKNLLSSLADPAFYRGGSGDVAAANSRLQELEKELHDAYGRWEFLEERKALALAAAGKKAT